MQRLSVRRADVPSPRLICRCDLTIGHEPHPAIRAKAMWRHDVSVAVAPIQGHGSRLLVIGPERCAPRHHYRAYCQARQIGEDKGVGNHLSSYNDIDFAVDKTVLGRPVREAGAESLYWRDRYAYVMTPHGFSPY